MILLDTNVLSEPWRPAPDPAVVTWLDAQAVETLYLSTVSLAEIRFGVAALPMGRRRHALMERVENELLPVFEGRILAFDEAASAAYADLRASARAQGRALGVMDALIAGVAASRGLAVATRDGSAFEAAGLRVINPFSEP